jgi:outer membrane murein-binding lipoprotein Lpp
LTTTVEGLNVKIDALEKDKKDLSESSKVLSEQILKLEGDYNRIRSISDQNSKNNEDLKN